MGEATVVFFVIVPALTFEVGPRNMVGSPSCCDPIEISFYLVSLNF